MMKTLDEVIDALEKCLDPDGPYDLCKGCPYDTGRGLCDEGREKDCLYYLKMYRSDMQMYSENQKYWEDELKQKIKDFGDAKERYIKRLKELDIGTLNDPLSWEQLKQMEGKPVWVESSDSFNRRRWMFVGEWFDDDEMRLFDMGYDYPDYVSKNSYESGTWQAYRKERK